MKKMINYLKAAIILILLINFASIHPVSSQNKQEPVGNQVTLSTTRLLLYKSVDLLWAHKFKANNAWRVGAFYKPSDGSGEIQETHPFIIFSVDNTRKESDIYGFSLGIEQYRSRSRITTYWSGDLIYHHWMYYKALYDNGSGMDIDHYVNLQTQTLDIYGVRVLGGFKLQVPRHTSRIKMLLDFYTGLSLGAGFKYNQVFGSQKSNDAWVYYDAPLESKQTQVVAMFNLGLRLGLGWGK